MTEGDHGDSIVAIHSCGGLKGYKSRVEWVQGLGGLGMRSYGDVQETC